MTRTPQRDAKIFRWGAPKRRRTGGARVQRTCRFSSFRASQCQAKSPIKTMRLAQVTQKGNLFFFDFAANAFLHHMIRNIVGALVYVGAGRLTPKEFKQSLI